MSWIDRVLEAFGRQGASEELAAEYGLSTFCGMSGRQRRQVLLTQAVLRGALRSIVESFGEEVPFLLLKGQPLQEMLYGGRYLRPTGDIDLLVLPGDREEARRRILALGYRPKWEEGPRMWVHNQEPFIHVDHGLIVELHWSVAEPQMPQPAVGSLFESSVEFGLDEDLVVRVLPRDWQLFQVVLHFHHHMGFAKGLVDVAAWLDSYGAGCDEGALVERARRLGMFGMMQWPLHTVELLVGERPPLWDDGADRFVRALAALSARAMRDCLVRRARGEFEASLVAVMPRVGPARGVAMRAASMVVVDGGVGQKGVACVRSVVEGPHFLGRMLAVQSS